MPAWLAVPGCCFRAKQNNIPVEEKFLLSEQNTFLTGVESLGHAAHATPCGLYYYRDFISYSRPTALQLVPAAKPHASVAIVAAGGR